jgi:hypothetical protein
MSKPPVKPIKPFSEDKIQQCPESDGPEIEHVEQISGPRTGLHSNSNTPVDMADKCQFYSPKAPLSSCTLANARAALQQLLLKSRYDSSYIPLSDSGSQSPIRLPAQPPPAMVAGQFGIQNYRRSSCQSAYSSSGFIARCAQAGMLPAISFGDDAPMPRWRMQRVQLLAPGNPALRWMFDAGPKFARYGWTDDIIYEYAYRWLEDALDNPSSRRHVRCKVLDATTVADNEISLPIPPPAPNTTYFQSWSGAWDTNNSSGYLRTDHERPRMARPLGT